MQQRSILTIAAATVLALSACGESRAPVKPSAQQPAPAQRVEAPPAGRSTIERVESAFDTPAQAEQAELDLNLLGRITPPFPDGYIAEGGSVERAGGGETFVDYGRWTNGGSSKRVMIVERVIGTLVTYDGGKRRPRAQIVQVFPVPAARESESFFTEGCSSPDYSATETSIYAYAQVVGERAGVPVSNEPRIAWRLDPESARLTFISTRGMVCEVVGDD